MATKGILKDDLSQKKIIIENLRSFFVTKAFHSITPCLHMHKLLCGNQQYCTLIRSQQSSHMTSLTNKNTVLPRARIYFLRHDKIVILFALNSYMISLTNENTVFL